MMRYDIICFKELIMLEIIVINIYFVFVFFVMEILRVLLDLVLKLFYFIKIILDVFLVLFKEENYNKYIYDFF